MTDRHSAYIVILDNDLREDDAEATLTALRMVKGVAGVRPLEASPVDQIARMRADTEWRERIINMLTEATS